MLIALSSDDSIASNIDMGNPGMEEDEVVFGEEESVVDDLDDDEKWGVVSTASVPGDTSGHTTVTGKAGVLIVPSIQDAADGGKDRVASEDEANEILDDELSVPDSLPSELGSLRDPSWIRSNKMQASYASSDPERRLQSTSESQAGDGSSGAQYKLLAIVLLVMWLGSIVPTLYLLSDRQDSQAAALRLQDEIVRLRLEVEKQVNAQKMAAMEEARKSSSSQSSGGSKSAPWKEAVMVVLVAPKRA